LLVGVGRALIFFLHLKFPWQDHPEEAKKGVNRKRTVSPYGTILFQDMIDDMRRRDPKEFHDLMRVFVEEYRRD
jgi:hypothetical protein